MLLTSHDVALPGSDDRLLCQLPDAKPSAAMLPLLGDEVEAKSKMVDVDVDKDDRQQISIRTIQQLRFIARGASEFSHRVVKVKA